MRSKIGKVVIDAAYGLQTSEQATEEERKIEEIVSNCQENEYNAKIAREKNWAILFSLSHIRGNAIEWLPVSQGEKVLEIGSGYGALTSVLAEKSGFVTCVEPSPIKNKINAQRNRNREGIEICQGNWMEISPHLKKTYDWIFLMDAWGEAASWIDGADPWAELLKSVKEYLAPGGKIVLASDNRLGLRYFAGCREPYSQEYFRGIEGYAENAGKKTFSRPEMEQVIHLAGLEQIEFYYPYPDYHLPMTIYSDEHLPKVGELWDNLRNFDQERYLFFDEMKAFDQIIKDGLFPVFSNSFLAVIRAEKEQVPQARTIFSKYSNERARVFAIRTDIWKDEEGIRHAGKAACYPEGRRHIDQLPIWMEQLTDVYKDVGITMNTCHMGDERIEIDFLKGQTLEEKMDHFLLEGKAEEAIRELMRYIQAVRQAGSSQKFYVTPEFEQVFGPVLLPEGLTCGAVTDIDMVAGNAICCEQGWVHMDYEWSFDFPIPVNYVIYRIIQNYLYGNVERKALNKELLYKRAGLTEQEIAQYTDMEAAFQHYITGKHVPLRYLYEEISPGCVNFQAEEANRKAVALANAQANKGIEVFVDTFEIAMTGIHVNGWAVSKADKQVSFALLDEQGRELETVKTEYLYRRDVVDQFKLSGKNSKAGFHLECRLPEAVQKNRKFTLVARDGSSEVQFPIPVEKLRIKQSRIGKKLMDLRGAKDTISYIAPHEMGLFGESDSYRVENQRFDTWRMAHQFTEKQRISQQKTVFAENPKISVILPVRDGQTKAAAETLESIRHQTVANWEVLMVSEKKLKKEDEKVRGIAVEADADLGAHMEAGRKQGKGDWLLFMEPGDILESGAFYQICQKINLETEVKLIYSDSDKIDSETHTIFEPQFKPDDSPYTLQSGNYIGNSIWIHDKLAEEVGGIREGYGSQPLYDLILRCREKTDQISHISEILYHESCPMERDLKGRQELCRKWDDGKRVLESYYASAQIQAQVTWANYPLRYRVKWQVKGSPKVSVIIPNQDHIADLEQCLSSIQKKTTYTNYEVLVVENNSRQPQTFAWYEKMLQRYRKVKLLKWEKEFNYSAINNFAAKQAEGEYLIFLNNDTEILTPDWIQEMLSVCQQKKVGVVGAKLYYPDDTIQHAGVILGLSNIAGHLFVKEPGNISGYMGRACTMQNLSAVTAACMMASAEIFRKVGGFEEKLQVALNDVDFCMKVQEAGEMVVFQPEAELYHYESKSRGLEDTPEKKARYDREVAYFRGRWKEVLEKGDPYYNVNLSRTTWNCTFRIPPAAERK